MSATCYTFGSCLVDVVGSAHEGGLVIGYAALLKNFNKTVIYNAGQKIDTRHPSMWFLYYGIARLACGQWWILAIFLWISQQGRHNSQITLPVCKHSFTSYAGQIVLIIQK